MVAVFSIFATLSMLIFKQFGVGLAAAILIDATLVRGVLLPATMKLLGERNWYLPALAPVAPAPRARRALDGPGGNVGSRIRVGTARVPAANRRGRDPSN